MAGLLNNEIFFTSPQKHGAQKGTTSPSKGDGAKSSPLRARGMCCCHDKTGGPAGKDAGVSRRLALPFLALVALYRYFFSPFLPKACRFLPTCSDYATQALKEHGPLRGGLLTLQRLGRCHPWGGQGVDPVPPAKK